MSSASSSSSSSSSGWWAAAARGPGPSASLAGLASAHTQQDDIDSYLRTRNDRLALVRPGPCGRLVRAGSPLADTCCRASFPFAVPQAAERGMEQDPAADDEGEPVHRNG